MRELEWLGSPDTAKMLSHIAWKASSRKMRLFSCGCCRRIWRLITEPALRRLIEAVEQYADGSITEEEFDRYDGEAWYAYQRSMFPERPENAPNEAAWTASWLKHPPHGVAVRVYQLASKHPEAKTEIRAHPALVRDIFGNPFSPAALNPTWLAWNGGTVAKLAGAIYEERRFADLPILADALEDAGCADSVILAHCRGPGEHVRGCWVIDLLTGRG